ncbi:hypothetical protein [Deinococcus gobiensis]|uniref:Uncharacterized protein n=1 Tax=Deinococcus gobiensis (strain DSM 21396 / JCM 16679 / CGMCC 1.7299 / I-0) TaxID=745776 RepID=H8H406_DEIGI|nr:hypothetical protein [Deinococcus gobiensis]AFD28253.1 hypothetical protein DGo_PF0030 [Deinococcus gobiensis I-0]
MDDLTPSEQHLLKLLAYYGPLTTRRIIRLNPKPNWRRLLTRRIVVEHCTAYGRVIAPSRETYDAFRKAGKEMPYLIAPGSAADRAFQMDAIWSLQDQGYEVSRAEYKGSRHRNGKKTSQVLYVELRTPQAAREAWAGPIYEHFWRPARGYPYLYASVANGGLKVSQVRKLVSSHKMDRSTWQHPLIIAVPNAEPLRAYHRQLEAKREHLSGPMLQIIELPPPPEGE